MREPKHIIYKLTDVQESKLWNDAIFVFDSSALLDFYFLPIKTRIKVWKLFSVKLKNRLWIPSHVDFEYSKNRLKVIKKPISEKYSPLKDTNLKSISKSLKEIEVKINDLQNRTKNEDKHPHISQKHIKKYLSKLEAFKTQTKKFENITLLEIKKREDGINQLPESDDVEQAISTYFKVGRYYSYNELLEISKEGKHRYEYKIPPGYEDLFDDKKKGLQIFGDLIIWKQVLEYAKKVKKPIIFICNDLKADWCYLEEYSTEKRIESPREELIKEFYDTSSERFWMYNQVQFLYKLNEYFEAKIDKENIDNLNEFIGDKIEEKEILSLKCNRCKTINRYNKIDLDIDFDEAYSYQRQMGKETEYQSTDHFDCTECGGEINVTFHLFEYPKGVYNNFDINVDGATQISSFDFPMVFSIAIQNTITQGEIFVCEKCGKDFDNANNTGICNSCEEEYNNK